MVTFSHADQGTAEAAWAGSELSVAPELPLGPDELAALRFVVLAAHPDDETLGAGGLMARLAALGAQVEVLLCTAGEGSHPDSPTTSPEELAQARLAEFAAALTVLGLGDRWRFLGFPDRGLGSHADAIAAAVRDAAARLPGRADQLVLVAPYRSDGHSDHDALGAVAAETARKEGHALLEYPIWYWHWATPGDQQWRAWLRFPLDGESGAAKERAMAAHATQVMPLSPAQGDETLLSRDFLGHFARGYEVFAWTPPRDASGPAHSSQDAEEVFDVVHNGSADPWNYASSWYERRKRAITLAALPDETYERGLEVGCSIGTLTEDLAGRCRSLLAVDASGAAVRRATRRLDGNHGVRVEQRVVPGSWPRGTFDLLVVSEVGYYLAPGELADLWDRVEASLEPGGVLVLCHWRHPIDGWQLDGDTVHALARQRLRWPTTGLYRERDFVLEILVCPARGTGVA
ncbi:LmbE family N-acetylglucosaminyl deacetylase [Arthrobacter sp. AG258]|uniref:bifunctional PIG-L family deacetylase/class I SAM-dependent methyltransferase n=1 Tax=Arthrobacter sp. AG258 TaxID=2183899 RepID=UPI0010609593|nr:bifunctional PIG-L family deacetylase/class I SAM-dependent methyltransferase [Arthrobacter sp. AG258]TDT81528.1 LmbE family N-acetylglucosaminyl deacetylase [Arthrobacter sp. AG258]